MSSQIGVLGLIAPRNLLETHMLNPSSHLLDRYPGGPGMVLTSPSGESVAHPSVRTTALGSRWFHVAIHSPFSGFGLAGVGTMATSSHSLPLPHNPDASSGPDLSEGPHSCPGGGRSQRLRQQSCSDKRVSAAPPSPLPAGPCGSRGTGGLTDRLSRC